MIATRSDGALQSRLELT